MIFSQKPSTPSSCARSTSVTCGGSPKLGGGTFLGVPIIRIIVFWVYIGVPLFWETAMLSLGAENSANGQLMDNDGEGFGE